MKKTLIYIAISAVVVSATFFAYGTASAQDYYSDGGGWGGGYGDYSYGGGWDSSYGGGFGGDSYGGGWGSSYDLGCGAGGCGGSSYGSGFGGSSYGGGWDSSYGGSACGYGGCGGSSFGGSSFGSGFGFGGCGMGGCGGSSYFAPQNTNVSNVYTNTVAGSYNTNVNTNSNTNINNGGGSIPPVYIPPVYVPPTYYPPTYNPPPVYTPPPIYYPPPVYTPPPLACTVTFSNFNPTAYAVEGQWYSYSMQAVSTLSNQISYRLVSGPDGLIVSPTGQITWTPSFNQGRGTAYEVRVAAYNGGCETNRTFYITVHDSNPVPPPPVYIPPRPVPPAPVACCGCVVSSCAVAPRPIVTGVCPPTEFVAPAAPIAPVAPSAPVVVASSGTGFWVSLGTAIAAMGSALTVLLYSPFLLLLVVLVIGVLLFRAYVRSRETTVII